MDVSPQTLREVEFRGALRGYNPDDVDEFLDRVAAGIEILQERLRQATERAVRAEARLNEVGEGADGLRNTLVLAQRTADLAVQEAKDQAAAIIAEAEQRTATMAAEAERAAAVAAVEAQRQLRTEIAELGQARDALRADVAALEAHLDGERTRVREALTEVMRRLDAHASRAGDAPPDTAVRIPPPREVPEPAPTEAVSGAAEVSESVEVAEPGEVAESPEDGEPEVVHDHDDPFLAELRLAATDTEPLGPRDEDADRAFATPDPFFDQDGDEHRFGSRLRRRK